VPEILVFQLSVYKSPRFPDELVIKLEAATPNGIILDASTKEK
jgi:hypothetical protein